MPNHPAQSPLLVAHALSVRYGTDHILSHIDFAIHTGEIVTIIGPNGAGKSTLVRALLGHIPIQSGTIQHSAGLTVGYVPQNMHPNPYLPISVKRFLSLPSLYTFNHSPHKAPINDTNQNDLDLNVQAIAHVQLKDLSGGQLQKVLLFKALATKPQLLILDEPNRGLDQAATAAFYRTLERVHTTYQCAVLMISHDLHVVMRASNRVVCLNGHICCQGTPQAIAEHAEYKALFVKAEEQTLALYHHHHDHTHH